MAGSLISSAVFMDTAVSVEVVASPSQDCADRVEKAFGWFREVEERCSRFEPASELSRLCGRTGVPVEVSPLLFRVLEFALAVASASGGAFDPTVGRTMELAGFDQNYRTETRLSTRTLSAAACSYRDVVLNPKRRMVTLRQPLTLDLGAVAKGLAVDLAAEELGCFEDFAVDAGGDLFLRGRNAASSAWTVGIRHPRDPDSVFETLQVSGMAVCTSGDYERRQPAGGDGHHVVDPRTGTAATGTASVTVVAPTAMAADALGTAAFVLGPHEGIELLKREGVDGLIVTSTLETHETTGFSRYRL